MVLRQASGLPYVVLGDRKYALTSLLDSFSKMVLGNEFSLDTFIYNDRLISHTPLLYVITV